MSSVVISGDTSGAITLAAPSVAGTNTATLPAATGTVMVSGNQPAFNVYAGSPQSGLSSNTYVKVALNTKNFDTNTNFDATTNYRFTPTVAGYYQLNGALRATGTGITLITCSFYKNGSEYVRGNQISGTLSGGNIAVISSIIYCNGSTDYIELYGLVTAASGITFEANSSASTSSMSGCLIRAA
jgi:hypothetical protein